jgi:hypothetical protein
MKLFVLERMAKGAITYTEIKKNAPDHRIIQ